jgi:predicted  nucleic acid-binding Zn-ribbon protein
MNPWEQFLEVQRHDTALDQLEHRRSSTPERAELAALPDEYTSVDTQVDGAEEIRHGLHRDQRRLEDEIGSLKERRDQATAKLYDGSVTAPKELTALQDDIASIDRRISTLEDQILEIMEAAEPVDADLARLAAERAGLDERSQALQARIAEVEADIDAEVESIGVERAASVEGIPADLVSRYDKARSQLGGVAVARLVRGVCDGCHLTLPAVEVDRVKHLPIDEPVNCEECGRFLVR